jgi:hypothetical protein
MTGGTLRSTRWGGECRWCTRASDAGRVGQRGGGSDLVGKRGTRASSRSCGDEGGRVEQVGWAKMARNWIWNLTKALGFDLGRI